MSDIRVRFAPSPTGHLHIGGLRSAIFNWLFAKKNNGKFLIRIEDTDRDRSTQEYTNSILESFAWMNMQSDEPIFMQTSRLQEHIALVEQLLKAGRAYRCFCIKKDNTADESYTKYDRTCLTREVAPNDVTLPHVVRFKLPNFTSDIITFNDLIYGEISYPVDQFDDFIILRSNGEPIYNFVVVADDIYQRISHIIRGQDHLVNTPKQIMLYDALGATPPQFAHLPLILGPSGAKLSKREAATSVINYKEDGYLPDALFNYLVRLGWSHGDQEIFTRQELINYFDFSHVNRAGAIFDIQKLDWVNGVYIKNLSNEEILTYIVTTLDADFAKKLSFSPENLIKIIGLYKERVKTLKELMAEIVSLNESIHSIDEADLIAYKNSESIDRLKTVEADLQKLLEWNEVEIANCIKMTCKQLSIKLPDVAKPIRLAITGKVSSPGIFELLALLPKQECLKRISTFIKLIAA